jgi:hypothetical protein
MSYPDDPVTDDAVIELQPLFHGDTGQLPEAVRGTLVFLLKRRYISAETNPREWQVVLEHEAALRTRLHDVFLDLIVDRGYEVAFKRQAVSEGGSKFPTLLYDAAYSKEETILLVALRRLLRARAKAGHDAVFIDKGELLDEIAAYRPSTTTDHARDTRAALSAIDSLLKMDLLIKTAQEDRYRVPTVIEVLLPVRKLRSVLEWLQAENGTMPDTDDDWDNEAGAADDDGLADVVQPAESVEQIDLLAELGVTPAARSEDDDDPRFEEIA